MPKVRPWVCQKFATLGPASFQDAIWKCFKCQKKCDSPSSVFISFLSWSSFPLVSFIVSMLPLWGGLSSTWNHLFPEKALHLLLFCFLLSDSLTQSSLCLFVWPWEGALPLLSASCVHGSIILFLDKDTGHSTSCVLFLCGHFKGPPFMKSHVFSKCVPMMATGYSVSRMSWPQMSPGDGKRIVNIIPQHTWRDSSRWKRSR